jgi:hypothetical protein
MAASALAAFAKSVAPAFGAATCVKDAPPAFVAPALGKSSGTIGAQLHTETKLVATIDAPRGVATLDFDLTQPSK